MSVQQIVAIKEKAIATKEESKSIEELINLSINELGKATPDCLKPERLARIAVTTLRLNPELARCTPQSFLGALFQSAQLGLEPNVDGQAYFIPFENSKKINGEWVKFKEVQFIIGYKGYATLFYRHNLGKSLDMQTVYENDEFDYEYGTFALLRHKPTLKSRGKAIAYYAIAELHNGAKLFQVWNVEDCLEHGKKHSKSYDSTKSEFGKNSPWTKTFDAMAKKTVVLQLMKLLPKSSEMQIALDMDNTTKSKVALDMFDVKDETNWDNAEITTQRKEILKNEK